MRWRWRACRCWRARKAMWASRQGAPSACAGCSARTLCAARRGWTAEGWRPTPTSRCGGCGRRRPPGGGDAHHARPRTSNSCTHACIHPHTHNAPTRPPPPPPSAPSLLELALPLALSQFLGFALSMLAVMFIGRLGELQMSMAVLATSFMNVTGYRCVRGGGRVWWRVRCGGCQTCGGRQTRRTHTSPPPPLQRAGWVCGRPGDAMRAGLWRGQLPRGGCGAAARARAHRAAGGGGVRGVDAGGRAAARAGAGRRDRRRVGPLSHPCHPCYAGHGGVRVPQALPHGTGG